MIDMIDWLFYFHIWPLDKRLSHQGHIKFVLKCDRATTLFEGRVGWVSLIDWFIFAF